jgi:hypothetical protein
MLEQDDQSARLHCTSLSRGHCTSVLQYCAVAGMALVSQLEYDTGVSEPTGVHLTERPCVPPPHQDEQVDQPDTNQWNWGQACALQVALEGGFAASPAHLLSSCTTLLPSMHCTSLLCVPPPHEALQGPQISEATHLAPTQGSVAQVRSPEG